MGLYFVCDPLRRRPPTSNMTLPVARGRSMWYHGAARSPLGDDALSSTSTRRVRNMQETPTLSPEAEMFLHLLNDAAVGGTYPTPAIEQYQHVRVSRHLLRDREGWVSNEGVHLNPASKSLLSALPRGTPPPEPEDLEDRVMVLDFDIYNKDGSLKGDHPLRWEEVLDHLKDKNLSLPYCVLESGSKGNFHLIWIYESPHKRLKIRNETKKVTSLLGGDTRFTNGLMRNPIYYEHHAPEKVHWWSEWSNEYTPLPSPKDLIDGVPAPWVSPPTVSWVNFGGFTKKNLPGYPCIPAQASSIQLEQVMSRMVDGDGRFKILQIRIRKEVYSSKNNHNRYLTPYEMRRFVNRLNLLFSEPMETSRIKSIIDYWSYENQSKYFHAQRNAALKGAERLNRIREEASDLSVLRYFALKEFISRVTEYHKGQSVELEQEILYRMNTYPGTRKLYKGVPTHGYVAHLLSVPPKDKVDTATGEIVGEVSPYDQVKNVLIHGNRNYAETAYDFIRISDKYSKKLMGLGTLKNPTLEPLHETLEQSDTSSVATVDEESELTPQSRTGMIEGIVIAGNSVGPPRLIEKNRNLNDNIHRSPS